MSEDSRSRRLAEAGFTARDRRLACDECGGMFTAQLLPIHKCPGVPLYERLNTLSKLLESSGRIDESEYPGAYAAILDAMNAIRTPADALEAMQAEGWQHIDTAPQDGYMLVHEDGALRALMRIKGVWHKPGYPALVANNYWADVLVGNDAKRVLDPLGYHLELRDGCCENPTHWMPLPRIPDEQKP